MISLVGLPEIDPLRARENGLAALQQFKRNALPPSGRREVPQTDRSRAVRLKALQDALTAHLAAKAEIDGGKPTVILWRPDLERKESYDRAGLGRAIGTLRRLIGFAERPLA